METITWPFACHCRSFHVADTKFERARCAVRSFLRQVLHCGRVDVIRQEEADIHAAQFRIYCDLKRKRIYKFKVEPSRREKELLLEAAEYSNWEHSRRARLPRQFHCKICDV